MDAYDRYTNLGKKTLPIVLLSMVEAEKFSDHLLVYRQAALLLFHLYFAVTVTNYFTLQTKDNILFYCTAFYVADTTD
jgi:hypothetical protein